MLQTFLELMPDACRWPLGEAPLPDERPGSATLFCGAPIVDRGAAPCPYCPEHAALAHRERMAPPAFQRRVIAVADTVH
jgi:hypothetical protein